LRDLHSFPTRRSSDLPFVRQALPRLFHKTLEGLQRVRDIVRNLRDFACLDEAEFKEVNLNACLDATAEVLCYATRQRQLQLHTQDRKSTRLNSSHSQI